MRIPGMTIVVILTAATAYAGQPARLAPYRVAVCSDVGNGFVIAKAETIAAGIFNEIGVGIDWHQPNSCPPDAIHIDYSDDTPPAFLSASLAYARPYEGIHIVVFFDRIKRRNPPRLLSVVLGHVMVHEISHILQGVQRHSESGIMKAWWNRNDISEMAFHPLSFTDEDVNLIHKGLEARESRVASLR